MRHRLTLILALAAKDWKLFLSDRRAALLGFAVPIVLASAFGLIFAKPTGPETATKLPLLLVVQSEGAFTERVVAGFRASDRMTVETTTLAEAEARVADRRPAVAVVLPADLEALAAWTPGKATDRPAVRVLHHPMAASEGQWAEGLVTEALMKRVATDAAAAWGATPPATPFAVATTEAAGTDAAFNPYTHSFSGMTLQYLLFWGMESGLLLLRDRRRSLWLRLRAAPVPLTCVLLGRAVATAGIALLQVLATFGFGYLTFGVVVGGSLLGFAALAVCASLLAAATGLLVAAVGGTEARARSVSILAILGVSMLGGLWLPSFVLPGWARDAALALPTTWAMRGLDAVTWQGRGFAAAVPPAAVLVGFTALFLGVAAARFVTSEARRRRGYA